MKILYIDHYAGSIYHGMEFRPYYLSREWIKMGHEVIIVGASYSHLRQKNIEMTQDIQEENIDGIRYIWLKTPKYEGNGIGRIKNMLTFLRKLYKYLPKITKDFTPDAVIASSTYPLDAYPANWIAKKCNAKFVFELHDLWPLSPMVYGNMSKLHPFICVMQRAEGYWCKNADIVVSVLSHAYKHLVTRGMSMDKYHVIPNGVVVEDWENCDAELPQEHKELFAKLKAQGKFIVGYLGTHGVANHLEHYLEIAKGLKDNSDICFVMVGKGAEKENLIQKAKEMQLESVFFLPAVPKALVPALLNNYDICSAFIEHTEIGDYGMSLNKLCDYMMSATPIVWGVDVPNDIVKESGCGYTVLPEEHGAFIENVKRIQVLSKVARAEIGMKGKNYVLKHNAYSNLAKQFIRVMSNTEKQEEN